MRRLAEGDRITHHAGPVLIVLTCVRPGAAYRTAVCYGSTGREVAELSRSYPSQDEAEWALDLASEAFADGRAVEQHLALVGAR